MGQDAHGPVLWQALCWVQICTRLAKPGDSSEPDAGQFSTAAMLHTSILGLPGHGMAVDLALKSWAGEPDV